VPWDKSYNETGATYMKRCQKTSRQRGLKLDWEAQKKGNSGKKKKKKAILNHDTK